MAKAQNQQKEYAQQLQQQVTQGPSAFDSQGAALQQSMQESSNQAIQAQQKALQRQAMAAASGSPVMAGASSQAAQQLGESAADAAVKASGAAGDYQRKMFEAQQQVAMRAMETATAAEIEKRKQNVALAGTVLEVAGELGSSFVPV